jgi:hypothetical protein
MNSARGRNESIDDRDELSHVPAPKAPTTPKPKLSENGNKKLTQIIALKNGENNKHVSCLCCAQCRAAAPSMHPATYHTWVLAAIYQLTASRSGLGRPRLSRSWRPSPLPSHVEEGGDPDSSRMRGGVREECQGAQRERI